MTAVPPLQLIHQKGFFGNHHKKNESNLLNISELRNFTIVQIVRYKKSTIQLNNIKINNLEVPTHTSKVVSNDKDTRILWSAPNTWLVISNNENIIKTIEESCNEKDFAITDISHSRASIEIKGPKAKEVLKKGCPINFNEFEKNNCVGSVFHGINIVIDCVESKPQIFNIITLRSFGESLYHHITDAALEFGYIGK